MRIAFFQKNYTNISSVHSLASSASYCSDIFSSKAPLKKNRGDSYYNLEISVKEVSDQKLFYSSFGTPARYLMEMYINMARRAPSKDEGILLFNPFFRFTPRAVNIITESVDRNKPVLQLITDRSDTPLGYFFPFFLPENETKYLSLVSCMNAESDSNYLRTVFLMPVEVTKMNNLNFSKSKGDNGFNYNVNFERIYTWITDSAIRTLKKNYGLSLPDIDLKQLTPKQIQQLNLIRDNIPFTAIMPHHAGDMLFMSIAFKHTATYVTRVILSDRYSDILKGCALQIMQIKPLPLPITPTLRLGNNKSDEEFFWYIVSIIPETEKDKSFYYFWRSSREYRVSDFHLIDHFAFAMGESFTDKSQFISHRQIVNNFFLPEKKGSYKVLFHFEGGWPLKTYPPELQKSLVNLFYAKGFKITILTDKIKFSPKADSLRYENLEQFKNLLINNNILIGMDSFPVHYAAHVMGSPAICLFGNTKPINSDAKISDYYRYICNEMTCAGCFGFKRCPEYYYIYKYCKNFADPENITELAISMLRKLYGEEKEMSKSKGCGQ